MNTRTPNPPDRLSRPGAPGAHSRARIVLPRLRPMGARPCPRSLLPPPYRPRAVPSSAGGSGPSAAMRWRLPTSPV